MAVATAVPTITFVETTQDAIHVHGTLAVGASPLTYATKGITLSFAGLDLIKSSSAPIKVYIMSQAPAGYGAANMYEYSFNPGTTQANGLMQIFTGAAAQTALTELSAGAVPAGVSGDTIVFEAIFQKV